MATFETAIDRLKKYYEKYADTDSLKRIDDFVKSRQNQQEIAQFRQLPHTQRLIKMCSDRYKSACHKLMDKPDISEEERKLAFIDRDWAIFFITALGGNPKQAIEEMESELDLWIKSRGL